MSICSTTMKPVTWYLEMGHVIHKEHSRFIIQRAFAEAPVYLMCSTTILVQHHHTGAAPPYWCSTTILVQHHHTGSAPPYWCSCRLIKDSLCSGNPFLNSSTRSHSAAIAYLETHYVLSFHWPIGHSLVCFLK